MNEKPPCKYSQHLDLVLKTGLEPVSLAAHAPQTCVSTNSTT